MKETINSREIERIVNAYLDLGFIFCVDEEKVTKKSKKKTFIASYINENHDCITKRLEDIAATDLHSAYMHANKLAEAQSDLLINNESFLLLFNLSTNEEDKELLNKKIVKFLNKNPEYIEEKDIIKSEYYSLPIEDTDENIVENEINNKNIFDILNENKPEKKNVDEIDSVKLKQLIESAIEESIKKYETNNKEEIEKLASEEEIVETEDLDDVQNIDETTDFVLIDDNKEETTDFVMIDNDNNEDINDNDNKNNEDKNTTTELTTYRYNRNEIIQMPKEDIMPVRRNSNEVREAGKNVKVVNIEENKAVADKARDKSSKDSLLITAGLIILASAIGFAGYSIYKNRKSDDNVNNNIAYENTTEINNDIEDTVVVDNTNKNNENIEDTNNEETTNTDVEETTELEVVENTQEVVDIHSEDYINSVTDKTLTKIQLINDSFITAKYDRDLVDALVRYTHHNYPEYTGENILSNEVAYEDLSELIRHGFDISMFYEGLNNYENIGALYTAACNIKQEKGNYEDEFKVYMCMNEIMDDMNTNNFAEAIALRAYVDNYSMIPSMQMARQQAGVLEMKDTQDLWKDVNKDGITTYEENAEGKGYDDEKAAAIAAKYNEMSSETCKNIYNRISTDDHNSELTQIVYKAIDEDDARVRTR